MVETLMEAPSLLIDGVAHRQDLHAGHPGGRRRSPADMLHLIRPLLPLCGITRLANITGLDRIGVPVALAIRPNGKTLSTSAGKGLTLEHAFVSAAMEALETTVAEDMEPHLTQVNFSEVERRYATIMPQDLPLRPYAGFQPLMLRNWVFGWDVLQQCSTAVPLGMVRMGPAGTDPSLTHQSVRAAPRQTSLQEQPVFQVSSNGLASGGTLLEATFAALLEIIERDAVERSLNGSRLERLDVESFLDAAANQKTGPFTAPVISEALGPEPVALGQVLRSAGLRVFAMQIPSLPCTSVCKVFLVDDRDPSLGVYHGAAASLSLHQALCGALLEAIQSRAVYIAGSRDDCSNEAHVLLRRPHYSSLFARVLSDLPLGAGIPQDFSTGTLHGDIHSLLGSLRSGNLRQAILLDLSTYSLPGIHVVKLVVPGMRGPTAN